MSFLEEIQFIIFVFNGSYREIVIVEALIKIYHKLAICQMQKCNFLLKL